MTQERKAIFITGAGSGMGAATARRFAHQGWFVGAYDVDRDAVADMGDQIGRDRGLFERLDVTDADGFGSAVERFSAATGGRMDILFNNAGVIAHGPFETMAWDMIERIVRVNLLGPMIGVRAALGLLKATPNALCFMTSSASAIFGSGDLVAYSASKHGVRGLTEGLSIELAQYGIRVGDVMPGIIETGMVAEESKPLFPLEGPWRLMPPRAVADAVWQAYHADDEILHRYVPEELTGYQTIVSSHPDGVRDEARDRYLKG